MHNLSKALQLYIVERLHSTDRWKNLKVIFSDAFVPGEGEHKILDFIRSQRA
jgi:5'-3' exoribonuclease 2